MREFTFLYAKTEKRTDAFLLSRGITAAQYNVLAVLAEEDDGINQLSISQRMLVSQGNITRILDKLVHGGLIRREKDMAARRHKRIFIRVKEWNLHNEIKLAYDINTFANCPLN